MSRIRWRRAEPSLERLAVSVILRQCPPVTHVIGRSRSWSPLTRKTSEEEAVVTDACGIVRKNPAQLCDRVSWRDWWRLIEIRAAGRCSADAGEPTYVASLSAIRLGLETCDSRHKRVRSDGDHVPVATKLPPQIRTKETSYDRAVSSHAGDPHDCARDRWLRACDTSLC